MSVGCIELIVVGSRTFVWPAVSGNIRPTRVKCFFFQRAVSLKYGGHIETK